MIAIYARVSQDKDDFKNSIKTQIQFGEDYAKALGKDYEIYSDNGISGTLDIEKRPALFRLLQDIASGKISHVFAYDQSRLERNNSVWSNLYILFQTNNIKLHYHIDGDFDFESDSNFLTSSILSVFNSFFVKLTKTKVKNALQRNVENGKVHAIPPFGYTKDLHKNLIINEEEFLIVKRIFDMSLSGKGTDKIAEILNSEGVKTSYNKIGLNGSTYKVKNKYSGIITERKKSDSKWRGKTIQGIIKNTIYKGERFWKNNYYTAPAIIDESYWQKVNDNLVNNRNNTGKKVEHKYLLKGIIRCCCGRNMYGRSRVNKRDHTYICSSRRIKGENCGNRAINIDKIESLIWEHFFLKKQLLSLLNNNSNDKDKLIENLEQEKLILLKKSNDTSKGKANLLKAVAKGILEDDDISSEINQINQTVNSIKSELVRIDARITDCKNFEKLVVETRTDFESFSDNIDFDTKRNLIIKYIDNIVIAHDNRVTVSKSNFHIQIEFRNNIVKENYIFNTANGNIISLREKNFKLLSDRGVTQTMDFDTFQNSIICLADGRILPMPFMSLGKDTIILKNTIFPYGNIKDWNSKKIDNFYASNPDWLSKTSGININTEDINEKSYDWYVVNFRNFKDKSIEEWIKFLLKNNNFTKNQENILM